jgi:hypothetical protein
LFVIRSPHAATSPAWTETRPVEGCLLLGTAVWRWSDDGAIVPRHMLRYALGSSGLCCTALETVFREPVQAKWRDRRRRSSSCFCAFADPVFHVPDSWHAVVCALAEIMRSGRMAAFQCRIGRSGRTMHCPRLRNASFGACMHEPGFRPISLPLLESNKLTVSWLKKEA